MNENTTLGQIADGNGRDAGLCEALVNAGRPLNYRQRTSDGGVVYAHTDSLEPHVDTDKPHWDEHTDSKSGTIPPVHTDSHIDFPSVHTDTPQKHTDTP
jgi:hypothetical protein